MRKEPRPECLSTVEAVAYALPFLEPSAAAAAAHLKGSFQAMVSIQMQWIAKSLERTQLNPAGARSPPTHQ
jgi:DTW domain-containing protein YfiP